LLGYPTYIIRGSGDCMIIYACVLLRNYQNNKYMSVAKWFSDLFWHLDNLQWSQKLTGILFYKGKQTILVTFVYPIKFNNYFIFYIIDNIKAPLNYALKDLTPSCNKTMYSVCHTVCKPYRSQYNIAQLNTLCCRSWFWFTLEI
jgi:hypothetical protein